MPSRIKVLPANVANKIAAGEVVERPASVLKELLENSIDAGSTNIEIKIVSGGTKLVSLSDDGCGMNRDDTILCIERHATSKIHDVDDIEHITTLGFRGEALAAIASVSRFRLTTCAEGNASGTRISISAGKILDVTDFGCPRGTSVEVRDLFFNVPARRKFLRSAKTELAHIRDCFIIQALSHPKVGMALYVDDSELFRFASGGGWQERISDIFGKDLLKTLRPVEYKPQEVHVEGFVSLPSVNRADRNEQYLFVNGRPTSAALLNYAINEGYRTLLPDNRCPVVFLHISTDPTLVDVNVHPAKKEVRFRHPSEIRDAVIAAIRKALVVEVPTSLDRKAPAPAPLPGASVAPASSVQLKIDDLPPTRTFQYPRLSQISTTPPAPQQQGGSDNSPATPEDAAKTSAPWAWCRVVGQIGSLYVVLETEDGFILMDPHAAHERTLFDKFTVAIRNHKVQSQTLLIPETAELPPKDALRVRQNIDILKEMGFGISEFGGDSFVIDAIPSFFTGISTKQFLVDVSHGLEQSGARGGGERAREEVIARTACRSAVMARDRLSSAEIEQLVVDLAKTEMPYTCPHGRPTLIFTSYKELNRKFGRI